MEKDYIKLQGIDICIRQIDYINFGLKQAKETSYLVSVISITNHLLNNFYDIEYKDRQNLLSLLNKINIAWEK